MTAVSPSNVSVVIPAKNESASIGALVAAITRALPGAEILVVDDGSIDATGDIAANAGARVIHHPISRGNGAAVKTGARHASREILVFMDADGQHLPEEIPRLLQRLEHGYDMAVGARGPGAHASLARRLANAIYNTLASWITNTPILDLTSGFRAVRADAFRQFLSLLPNGFSYPTTSTIAFLRAGLNVDFLPVQVLARHKDSSSHIRPLRDGARFFIIIFKVATLYSPLKVYLPMSLVFFASGVLYYSYTWFSSGRFTNLGALFFSTAAVIFLIGLLSEQITTLMYLDSGRRKPND